MKNTKFIIFAILVLTLISCDLTAQIGEITIKNNSGKEITNIILLTPNFSYNENVKDAMLVDSLLPNKSIKFSYDLVNSHFTSSERAAAGSLAIEYYIEDVKFGMDDGNAKEISMAATYETVITINADGWSWTAKR